MNAYSNYSPKDEFINLATNKSFVAYIEESAPRIGHSWFADDDERYWSEGYQDKIIVLELVGTNKSDIYDVYRIVLEQYWITEGVSPEEYTEDDVCSDTETLYIAVKKKFKKKEIIKTKQEFAYKILEIIFKLEDKGYSREEIRQKFICADIEYQIRKINIK